MARKTRRISRKFHSSVLLPLIIAMVTAVPFILHAAHIARSNLLVKVEDSLYDARIRYDAYLRGMFDKHEGPRIVIVDIDDNSIAREGQWPWSRAKIAQLVENLFDSYGVRAVGFDMVFSEPDRGARILDDILQRLAAEPEVGERLGQSLLLMSMELQPDQVLAEALRNRPAVLGYIFFSSLARGSASQTGQLPQGLPIIKQQPLVAHPYEPIGYLGNLAELQSSAATAGYFDNPLVDADGIFRRLPLLQYYDDALYETLSLAMVRMVEATGPPELGTSDSNGRADVDHIVFGNHRIPVDDNLAALVPYKGPAGSFPYVPAADVLSGQADIEKLFDAIVLVGTTAPALFDLRSTPMGNVYPGVEIHANMINGILENRFWYEPDWVIYFEISVLLMTAFILALLLPRLSLFAAVLLILFLTVAGTAINFVISFGGLMVLPIANPVLYTFLLSSCLIAYSVMLERRKKRYLSRTFGKYVPRELVEQFEQSEAEVSLEGEARELTVMFSDIRDFTRISEGLAPNELTRLMNAFLTPVTEVIHQHKGNVDKYIGDAVMAFWGAPLTDSLHAQHALEAALSIVKVVELLNEDFAKKGWPVLKIGIGINTGVVSVGNMGSEYRTAYTVMGDAVNLGSRLEGLCKVYGVNIVAGEETMRQAQGHEFRELDRVRVKGKKKPITIYEPLGPVEKLTAEFAAELERYRQALLLYRQRDWSAAEQVFEVLAETRPLQWLYRLYLTRCQEYRLQPPPENWDGVYSLKTK